MFDVAVSELTSSRCDLSQEIIWLTAAGVESISLWRPKVTDVGAAAAARLVGDAGIRVSSLQSAGGFTGGDGRSFAESIDDAIEAIGVAAVVGAPCLVIHSGCRGGHTRSHASRLLVQAIEALAPTASQAGVALALKPVHPLAAPGCSFLAGLGDALDLVERFDDVAVRLALDLWHFGHEAGPLEMLPRLAAASAVVQVADRCGPPAAGGDRLPVGHGSLDLEALVSGLVDHGYRGPFEFDPVGEAVEILGYEGVWQETRFVTDAWADRHAARPGTMVRSGFEGERLPTARGHFLAGSGSGGRRSHASSHTGSPG